MNDAQAARATVFGATLSLVFHAALAIGVGVCAKPPEFDFEFELPMDIELGMSDEMMAAAVPNEPEPPPETEPVVEPEGEGETSLVDAGPPPPPDAGMRRPDAGVDAGPEQAGDEGAEVASEGTSRIPPGAQIALRLDLARVRASVLGPDVRGLLNAIPDWHLILDGSGIRPLEDLDRLLIASPNLQRAQLVIAGRHNHAGEEAGAGHAYVREVAARFGAARDVAVTWRTQGGVPVANWPNEDETERVIAIVGPRHFTITRPEDLVRVLAIARARDEADPEENPDLEDAAGPDALLSMGAEAAFTVEMEGIRAFQRRGRPELMPQSLRASVRHRDPTHIVLEGMAVFPNAAEAEVAVAYWEEQRERLMGNPFVAISGMGRPLRDARMERDGARVEIEAALTVSQTRLVISYLEGALVSRQRARERRLRQEQRGSADPTPMESTAMDAPGSDGPGNEGSDGVATGSDGPGE